MKKNIRLGATSKKLTPYEKGRDDEQVCWLFAIAHLDTEARRKIIAAYVELKKLKK